MSQRFNIRFAAAGDAEIIGDHRARMFTEMGQVPPEAFDELRKQSCKRIREYLNRGEYVGWLASPATDLSRVIGGAGVQLRQVLPHPSSNGDLWVGVAEGRHAIIINVFTDPAWRRQGLALKLIREIINWSRAERLDRLVLHSSDAARSLYQRLGFVCTNEMRLAGDE
jgi:GNAT superfamily N-acetyltransferase